MRRLALPAFALLAACGGETQSAPKNQAPAWSDAPAAEIALGEGQSLSLPLTLSDPDGDTPAATLDASGLAGVEAEIAADGSAVSLHANYGAPGKTSFTVVIDDGKGGTTRAKVDLDIEPIRWLGDHTWSAPAGPEAREHGALIVDAERDRVFLIGGSGYSPYGEPLGDVWRYDLAKQTWSQETPTGDVPAPGGSRRVAMVPGQSVAYLFGGYNDNFAVNKDLYRVRFDGETLDFKLIQQTTAPPARALHLFAYDAQHDRFVVFGGFSSTVLKDTWTLKIDGDTATWEKLTLPESPSGRYGFFYGVDEVSHRVIVFSGAQGTSTINPARDTWALDMTSDPPSWQLLAEGESVPPGRRNGCAVFDPTGPRLFVFGGTADGMTTTPGLFAFDARPGKAQWTTLDLAGEPPLRSSGIGFFDPATKTSSLGFGNTASAVYSDFWGLGH